jgi:ribosomal protein L4
MNGTGTGRAPQFRGGYKPHGPRERDFSFKMNRKGKHNSLYHK